MRLLFDAATDELHAQLSAWAHAARPPRFVVRRLLPESNTITVDISKPRPATTNADRFVVAYREDRAPRHDHHRDGGHAHHHRARGHV